MPRQISNRSSSSLTTFLSGSTAMRTARVAALMLTAGVLAFPQMALALDDNALPVNPDVVGGAATFDSPAANILNINQTTDRVVINWDSFNIGKTATTEFFQPNSSSLAVNRVVSAGTDPTTILGNLKANGNVIVLDRNGVIFGESAIVDVGGIVASTGDMDTEQVMSGAAVLDITDVSDEGKIVNKGQITAADAGLVALIGSVVHNSGTIQAHMGKIAMASGHAVTLDLNGDQLLEIAVKPTSANAKILNSGVLDAAGGSIDVRMDVSKAVDVLDSVINNEGIVHATDAQMIAGKIVLSAGKSDVKVRGSVSATESAHVTGRDIRLGEESNIVVGSEEAGGTFVAKASRDLYVKGSIDAGDGHVETSADTHITINGSASVLAGDWLIDPISITVADYDAASTINASVLRNALNDGVDVTLQTTATGSPVFGKVYMFSELSWASDADFAIDASNDIFFGYAGGLNATGAGNITLTSADDILMPSTEGTGIRTTTGDIHITTGGDVVLQGVNNFVGSAGGDIVINNTGALLAKANTLVNSNGGTITVNQNKALDEENADYLAYNTIQGSLDALANSGEGLNTINVGAGVWEEIVHIDKSNILLNGTRRGVAGVDHATSEIDATVISASPVSLTDHPLGVFNAHNVTVDGFDIEGGIGITSIGSDDVTFQNNVVSDSLHNGVTLGNNVNVTLIGNLVQNSDREGLFVFENIVDGNELLTVENNSFLNSGNNGIYLYNVAGEVVISGNIVDDSSANGVVAVGNESYGAIDLDITGNTITDSFLSGVSLLDMYGSFRITDNEIRNSTYGNGIEVSGLSGGLVYAATLMLSEDEGEGDVSYDAPLVITGNDIYESGINGIYDYDSALETVIADNIIEDSAENGILVEGIFEYDGGYDLMSYDGYYYGYYDVTDDFKLSVLDNEVWGSGSSGINLQDINGDILVDGNSVYNSGSEGSGDGILAENVNRYSVDYYMPVMLMDVMEDIPSEDDGYYGGIVRQLTISNNDVESSGYAGIEIYNVGGDVSIDNNYVDDSGQYGIYGTSYSSYYGYDAVEHPINLSITNNDVYYSGYDGIALNNMSGTFLIDNNYVYNSYDGNGISVSSLTSGYDYPVILLKSVEGEESDVAEGTLTISNNDVYFSGSNGIYIGNTSMDTLVDDNTVGYSLANGVLVTSNGKRVEKIMSFSGYSYAPDMNLDITNNEIFDSGYTGVYLDGVNGDITVSDNSISYSYWGDGVLAENVNQYNDEGDYGYARAYDSYEGEGYYGSIPRQLIVAGNDISQSGYAGVELDNVGGYVSIDDNSILNSGSFGVEAYNDAGYYGYYGDYAYDSEYIGEDYYYDYYSSTPIDLHITNNLIENNGYFGGGETTMKVVLISEEGEDGYYGNAVAGIGLDIADGYAEISDNTIGGEFDFGLLAYSGTVDLTGEGNTIHDTVIGMGFYPDESDAYDYEGYYGEDSEYDYFAELASRLHLVNDTIGETRFINQAEAFVDLGYGAFFAPGTPTQLDGLNATYTVGGSTIAPAVHGFVTADQHDVLESMFYHYVDSNDRGLFFFPIGVLPVPPVVSGNGVDEKDVFQFFGRFVQPEPSGSLTITGLPGIGGANGGGAGGAGNQQFALNDFANIAPAAGEEDDQNTSPENVEPAAGADANKAACWSDAGQALGNGSSVTMDFGSGAAGLLQDAANCGSAQGNQGAGNI